ncbi:MAG: DUF5689 domain-containing protein [Thiohalospira sp.]
MKKMNKKSAVYTLIIALSMTMFSCVDDEFDTPSSTTIPIGESITIQEVKNLYNNENDDYLFTTDQSIYAVVTMDDKSGNIYKTAYIQDETGAIALHLDASGGLYQGDSIRIQLNGLKVGQYEKLFQIDAPDGNGFTLDNYITKLDTKIEKTPEETTILNIISGMDNYQCKLVKLNNVQFIASDTSKTYADGENLITENRTIEDENGNILTVRTSGYAAFADESIPNGSGSLVAIVGQYRNDVQLYIRTVEEVEMNNERFDGSGGGDTQGSGTFDDPYNVASGITNQDENNVWVEGYLVGVYETQDASGNDLSEFESSFTAPFNTNTNVIIADNEDETNIANCVVVQLPAGDIRNAVNLADNSGNLGKSIKFLGNLTAYFGESGLKSVTGYWMDDDGIIPETGFFEEDFTSDLGSFTAYNVNGPQEWEWANYDNGCAVMSGYDGSDNANEDWLVSSQINLSEKSNVTMVIREAINYITSHDDMKVLVSTNYDGTSDPSTQGTWTELSGFNRPTGNSWDFVSSGDIDLSTYDGESSFFIAFKYISTTSGAATWEVGNILLKEGSK